MGKLIGSKASRRRAKRFEENLKNYYSLKEDNDVRNHDELITKAREEDQKLAQAVQLMNAKTRSRSKILEEYENVFHKNFTEVLTGLMAQITTESNLLEDTDIDKEALFESYKETFEYLYETDQILVEDSPVFSRLGGRVASYVGSAQEVLSKDELANVIASIYVNDPEMINPLVSNIQDKIANCIKEEKLSVQAKHNLTEDQQMMSRFLIRKKRGADKTLFRKLLEGGVNNSVNVTNLSEEATSEVMENSLAEAVAVYALLECLNTSKLVKFDNHLIKGYINYG